MTGLGTVRLLEAIRQVGLEGKCRFYQASSSRCLAWCRRCRRPRKLLLSSFTLWMRQGHAYWLTVNYRESYNMHARMDLFNHESPRRGETFVTRKITRATRIKMGLQINCIWVIWMPSETGVMRRNMWRLCG